MLKNLNKFIQDMIITKDNFFQMIWNNLNRPPKYPFSFLIGALTAKLR